jgi:hypothetical protein
MPPCFLQATVGGGVTTLTRAMESVPYSLTPIEAEGYLIQAPFGNVLVSYQFSPTFGMHLNVEVPVDYIAKPFATPFLREMFSLINRNLFA